jgi:hypothetical protein
VAAAFGSSQFTNSGYTLPLNGLGAGYYRVVVFARNVLSGQWQHASRVISVPPRAMAIDAPGTGSAVGQPFVVSGWAIDRAAAQSAGVDAVHVYAYPASGGPAIFLGAAQHGSPRPDIAALFGQRFERSGYVLTASGIPAGGYVLVVYARSTVTGAWQHQDHQVLVH